jgi:hypothetical protein
MLKAYIDGSHNDEIEVVAGFASTEQNWAGFDDAWRSILDKYKLDHFHTTDYWWRKRPFDKWTEDAHTEIRGEICALLKKTRAIAFGSVVDKSAYREWRVHQTSYNHPDPHYFALDRCFRFLIHGINIHPTDDGVEIMCDRDQEHEYLARDMQNIQEERLRQVKHRLPGHPDPNRPISFSFGVNRDNPGLQAADVICNAGLRWGVLDLQGSTEESQFLAGIKPDCPIALSPFMSREVIEIEMKVRNRPQDEVG